MMRILTLAPIFGGGIPLVDDIHEAMENLDVEVYRINEEEWVSEYLRAEESRDLSSFYTRIQQDIENAIDTFKPELCLSFALAPIPPRFRETMKQRGVKSAHWFFEDGQRFSFFERMAEQHTHFFCIQPSLVAMLRHKGQVNTHYLPLGVPPRCQKMNSTRPNSFSHQLAFVGTPSPHRVDIFMQLKNLELGLWGPGWSETNTQLAKFACGEGQWLSREEEMNVYRNAQLAINIHQDKERSVEPNFVNPRTFLLAAMGVPQILEDRVELASMFDLTNELTPFRPKADLYGMVVNLLENQERTERKAARARQRAMNEHLLEHRILHLLSHFDS